MIKDLTVPWAIILRVNLLIVQHLDADVKILADPGMGMTPTSLSVVCFK